MLLDLVGLPVTALRFGHPRLHETTPLMLRYRKVLQFTVVVLTGALLALGLLPRNLSASPFGGDPIRILLMGDSYSAAGDEYVSGKEDGQTYQSYADQLELDLYATHQIINIACPGSSLLDWTLETPGVICPPFEELIHDGLFTTFADPELPADIVTILLGTNDAIGWFEVTPVSGEAYAIGLDRLLATLRLAGAETIVLMTPPDRFLTHEDRDRLMDYRDTLLDRCTHSEDLVCGPDLFTLLDPESDFAPDDPHHPNAAGHSKIATALAETIRQIPEPTGPLLSIVAVASLALLGDRKRRRRPGFAGRSKSLLTTR